MPAEMNPVPCASKSTLIGKPAVDLAALVRGRQVSPTDVVKAYLEQIAALDPELHAFQVVRTERALAEAEALAARPDLGELPLAGVPVAIKDNVDVALESPRQGSAATLDTPATKDDELVRRLRAAGCIVIGKTAMPELAVWPFTEPEAYPPTRNPWNRERTPGGSTGGGGAAVAAGMAALALGSDGGGSIRVPAACCGVVGLKPGPGLLPLAGGAARHWLGLTEFGPLAHSVADLALMLDVLAHTTTFRDVGPPLRPLRVAVSTKPPAAGARVAPEVKAAVARAASMLASSGHQVVPADPPYPLDIGLRFMRRWLPGIAEDTRGLPPERLEERTRAMAGAGEWLRRRGWAPPVAEDGFGTRIRRWFAKYDLLLTATLAEPAVPIGRWRDKGWIAVGNWVFTTPWNLAGFPAASVPAGLSSDGLPLAVQVVASPGGEATLLALLAQLEQLMPWPRWGAPTLG